MKLDPSRAQKLVTAVSDAQDAGERIAAARSAISFLVPQLEELRKQANGYPQNSISAAVWMDGAALTQACDVLADVLSNRGLLAEEELACRLAVGMACEVMGHYPEQIFPRVLRHSGCREAMGQLEEAATGYDAIVRDFHELGLDELLEQDAESLGESERQILESVSQALERLQKLAPAKVSEQDRQLHVQVQKRLQQPDE